MTNKTDEQNSPLTEQTKQDTPKKANKLKKFVSIFAIVLLVGNVGMYLKERGKWLHKNQPYPNSKEWLIPANILLVYSKWITTLPFIDERSTVVKPLIDLQNSFVAKWKKDLPDNDAEKYMDWYIFDFMTHIIPNSGGIIMFYSGKYTIQESRQALDKAWETIEKAATLDAKDEEFQEIRYAAFNNTSVFYLSNIWAYWVDEEKLSRGDRIVTNTKKQIADTLHHERNLKLYSYIKQMNGEYATKHPKIYEKAKKAPTAKYSESSRLHDVTREIIEYLTIAGRIDSKKKFCDQETNSYLKDYESSKRELLEMKPQLDKWKLSLKPILSPEVDGYITSICKN